MPLTIAILLVVVAVRDEEAKYWPPAISTFAYCAFYMVGGRDVLFYLGASLLKCSFLL
jgi:hypothetical protein